MNRLSLEHLVVMGIFAPGSRHFYFLGTGF